MTSSVDPSLERVAILTRLKTLEKALTGGLVSGKTYEGIPQGLELPIDGFGSRIPYRDFEPGVAIPAGKGRMLAAHEQAQPHLWAFQIHHYAPTRSAAIDLATESDICLVGWEPTVNAGAIGGFFFQVYDQQEKRGDRIGWIATRFYETELGQSPDLTL